MKQQLAMARENRRLVSLLSNPKVPGKPESRTAPELTYSVAFAEHLQRWQSEGEYYPQSSETPPTPVASEPARTVSRALPEARAAAKLKLARTLAIGGNQSDAREYLEEIVARFSGTAAAAEAQRLLDSRAALRDFGKDR